MFETRYLIKSANREAVIKVPEKQTDYAQFLTWLDSHPNDWLAVDTETTGLDIFSDEFKVRTIQVGIGLEAWVLHCEDWNVNDFGFLLNRDVVFHNAAYDVLALQAYFGLTLDWSRITDTKILAHLCDPRAKREGGVGHSLEELTAAYIDEDVATEVKASMTRMCRETGLKKAELFASIDDFNETYLLYAGMDVVLTYALRNILEPKVPAVSRDLIKMEHQLAEVCCNMEANGFLLDVEYAQGLSDKLLEDQEVWEAIAFVEYGTESVNANRQVAADLIESGVKLTELTATGEYKLNKKILEPLVEQGHPLAVAVTEAKRAKKWRTSWVDKFLDGADSKNRVHANINPLLARTARMSITGIPAQTLPSSDWTIRRCFIADPGETIIACDYQSQELRVLAALSQDRNMVEAFRNGADLHQLTADASGVERRVGKTVNFAYVYGSGAGNIAETCNISVPKAREVIKGFESTYPGVKKLSERLQREAKRKGYITTPTGRVLPVDKDRPYAALNYMIQSTSRDITATALLRLADAGLTKHLRLPVHDEVILSVPTERAEEICQTVADIMTVDFNGVHVASDHDVYGPSWGSGYVTEDSREEYEKTLED